jgi:DNA-binding GntR family transcriptional regulator
MSMLIQIENAPDLVDRVWHALLDAICDGSLAPGARIMQEDIAAQLAVSRQPVLQALRLLKKDGFVQDAPGRGVLVAPLDAEQLHHIYQVRSALDALAARLAAQARYVLPKHIVKEGRQALSSGQIKPMIHADEQFHSAIYRASGNALIAQSAKLHWAHIRRAMGAVLQVSSMRASVWDEHEAIARAIAAGQADRAETLMRQHGEQAARNLSQLLSRALGAAPL